MVPGAPVAQRIKTGIQFRPTGLAHGGTEVSPVESEPLGRQSVDIGSLGILTSVEGQVVIGTVVGHNEKKVRGSGGPNRHGEHEQYEKAR
jgi:hypothetical protein